MIEHGIHLEELLVAQFIQVKIEEALLFNPLTPERAFWRASK